MMLDDDSLLIPYQIGDVFISHTQEETQEMLEAAKVGFLCRLTSFHFCRFSLIKERICVYFLWFYAERREN